MAIEFPPKRFMASSEPKDKEATRTIMDIPEKYLRQAREHFVEQDPNVDIHSIANLLVDYATNLQEDERKAKEEEKQKTTKSFRSLNIPDEYIHEAREYFLKEIFGEIKPNTTYDLTGMEPAIMERAANRLANDGRDKRIAEEQQKNLKEMDDYRQREAEKEKRRQEDLKTLPKRQRDMIMQGRTQSKCPHCRWPRLQPGVRYMRQEIIELQQENTHLNSEITRLQEENFKLQMIIQQQKHNSSGSSTTVTH
jgi:hypothetical protein